MCCRRRDPPNEAIAAGAAAAERSQPPPPALGELRSAYLLLPLLASPFPAIPLNNNNNKKI